MFRKDEILKYIVATRPWSLPASIVPALLGCIIGYQEKPDDFNVWVATVSVACVICVHIAGNLVNTYYDFVKGIDGQNSDDTTLVKGVLKTENIATFCIVSYIISCSTCFSFLAMMSTEPSVMLCLFSIGVALSFLYTGGLGLKYVALGDLVIVCTFGPVTVLYTYVAQTNHMSWRPVLLVMPLVCLTEAILHANNSRDLADDQKRGIRTLAILLGRQWSHWLYACIVLTPFLCSLYIGVTSHKLSSLLPCILLPHAASLIRRYEVWELDQLPQQTAQLNLMYGLLYIASFTSTF